MVPELAAVLARLLQRDQHTGDEDPLFLGERGYVDGSALRRRYKAAQRKAGLRPLRFHDLRHSFGSLAARAATTTRELQEWMGHADAKNDRPIHALPTARGRASRLASAFALADTASVVQANGLHEPAASFRSDAADEDRFPAQMALSRNGAERGDTF